MFLKADANWMDIKNVPRKQIFCYVFVLQSFPYLVTFTASFFLFKKVLILMYFRFMKQFYSAKHKAKLKHDADVCRSVLSTSLDLVEPK